jgi:hypothetical protein
MRVSGDTGTRFNTPNLGFGIVRPGTMLALEGMDDVIAQAMSHLADRA